MAVTSRPIIGVDSGVSGRIYDILTSIIAHLLTSQPFGRPEPRVPWLLVRSCRK